MKEGRQLPARDYASLKAEFRDLVEAAGGVTRAARITRVNAPRLSNYCSAQDPSFAPIDVIADLEAEVGEPVVTRILADLAGYVLVRKAAVERPVETIDRAAAPVMQAVGKAMMELGSALRDGVCTPQEAAAILPTVTTACAEIHDLDAALRARAAQGRMR